MRKTRRLKQNDPLEHAIEAALAPGTFISYNAARSFIKDVQEVADDVGRLIESDPARAVGIYETFIAACYEKADEIDDSSGSFGAFVDDLFCGWIKGRQVAGMEPDETAILLLTWMEEDTYGFCYDIEKEVVKVLDSRGLDAFARRIRGKFEAAPKHGIDKEVYFPDYARRWEGALKTVLAAQFDIEGYITLCKATELGAENCKVVADMCREKRLLDDALSWVERGMEIAHSETVASLAGHDLVRMKRALLAELGRGGEALEAAWAEFQKHPSSFSYKELMQYVPARERRAWHQKAMETSETGNLSSQIDLWLDRKEIDRLVARLRRATDGELENLSHYRTEPSARKIERSHPAVAARIYRALGIRIVNAGKSKYYDQALDNLERARKCYIKAGLDADWELLIADVRARHYRKKGFMTDFEQIVSGGQKPRKPTFLERAKGRWPKRGKL